MRYSLRQVQSRSILLALLRLTPPTEGFPRDDRKMMHGGQRMANVHSGEEILPKASTPWVWCTNVTDDDDDDDDDDNDEIPYFSVRWKTRSLV